jgi:acyl-CoA hydrolase
MIDKVAAIAAIRHVRGPVVTLSIDSLLFKRPVPNGALLTIKASVNRVFGKSLEVGVLVMSLPPGGTEEEHVCSAYLTFVALNPEGNPKEAPSIHPESPEEHRRFDQALKRRESRLALQNELRGSSPSESKTGAQGMKGGMA